MNIPVLISIYSLAIIVASLLGGWLPAKLRMGHTQTQILMSFVAGLMLGVAFYHLLPHAIGAIAGDRPGEGAVDDAIVWLMAGLLSMFVLLRLFHFHQHGVPEDDDSQPPYEEQHSHHDHSHPHKANSLSWMGVAFGLALHTFIDGVALAAAVQAQSLEGAPLGLLGLGVFAAIVLHKPLDAMSISSLMQAGGWSMSARVKVNLLFATMCPLGAYLFLFSSSSFGVNRDLLVGSALAFSAGVFICISLSDLLPEIQFHSHDRGKLTVALFLGVLTAYGIGLIEPESQHHREVVAAVVVEPVAELVVEPYMESYTELKRSVAAFDNP